MAESLHPSEKLLSTVAEIFPGAPVYPTAIRSLFLMQRREIEFALQMIRGGKRVHSNPFDQARLNHLTEFEFQANSACAG